MKIVCDSCGAKYSIADEKVAGKVFKIRCKRCSEVIMVRGDQEASASAAAAAPAGDAIWHVVVNGEQHGPYAPVQLGEMLTAGTVDWDAYVWCEGFDNWAPMRDVEDLVSQITGQGEPASAQQTAAGGFAAAGAAALGGTSAADAGAATGGAEAFAGEPSMGADPFADDPAPAAAPGSTPDLFTDVSVSAAPVDAGADVVASGPAAASVATAAATAATADASQPMTGARNENSVLFSLQNLQALATGSSAAPPASTNAGFATGDGSGLIDIRALAAATGVENQPADSDGEKDELLAMGGQGAAFGALGSPMLAPAPEEPEGGNRNLLIAALAIGGGIVVAGGMVAFAMINKSDEPAPSPKIAEVEPAKPAAGAAEPAAAPTTAAVAPQEAPSQEVPSEGAAAAQRAAEAEAAQNDGAGQNEAASNDKPRVRSKPRPRTKSTPAPKATAPKAAAPTTAPKPKSGGSKSIDALLDGALSGGGSKPKASKPKPAASNLPEKPSRADVIKAMNGVKKAVSACAKGKGGVATASITVAGPTGRVKSAQIQGQTGAVGSCIARAVRKARFPKFKANSFQIKYPFRL